MNYFVIGATGFIGKFFVEKLLQREGTIQVLVRKESTHKLDALRERFRGAGDAPSFAVRLDTKIFSFIPSGLVDMLTKLPPVKRFMKTAMDGIGMPKSATIR